ncbi:DUF222 domain-containing protein [Gordonia sp. PKS22-38]|uniref:DUF222 domain-containing protein n=1 Tax=Gordonia prachuapensis TaxID=3115651 RepID=A0ABU7MZ29_9ACTN|nr:DUF222 domain-containing protein [Gordonia sp. PKS22-38]
MSGPGWALSSWWRDPSPWPDVPPIFTGGLDASNVASTDTNDLIGALVADVRGEAFLAWHRYQIAAQLHARLVGDEPSDHDFLLVDGLADCAARVALGLGIGQAAAERLITEAIALRDRLPQVSQRLRDGRISAALIPTIISRTDLADGQPYAALVDAEIAAELDAHAGGWSAHRLRDMVDRIVFRHDPDAVRERRRRALDARGMRTKNKPDGMAEISATMAAENVRIAAAAVKALANSVCEFDERTRQQRASDAMFALLSGTPFECTCGRTDCTAQIPEPGTVPPVDAKVVVHVVADESTLNGTAQHAGFIAGHGVISDDHARDLAARPDAVISPLVPEGTPTNPDGTVTLPSHLPSDPYRPSAALDRFVRVRDGYSVIPGNPTSSFDADLDHVNEYNHQRPERGGQTEPDNLNAKDRFSHLLKTFGRWVDEQYRDRRGRLRTAFTTPEGLIIDGEPDTLETMFPGLRRIRFAPPDPPPRRSDTDPDPPPPTPSTPEPPTRSTPRVAAKHARRQQERERNRQRREEAGREQQERDQEEQEAEGGEQD